MQSWLEIGSVWDCVLVTFPRTWAPSNLKYCFSKSGSIKFHLILELKTFPAYPRSLLPCRNRIAHVFQCAELSGICATLQHELKQNILSVGYCLIHILFTQHRFFSIYLIWTTERNSFHWWGERFCKMTHLHSELW